MAGVPKCIVSNLRQVNQILKRPGYTMDRSLHISKGPLFWSSFFSLLIDSDWLSMIIYYLWLAIFDYLLSFTSNLWFYITYNLWVSIIYDWPSVISYNLWEVFDLLSIYDWVYYVCVVVLCVQYAVCCWHCAMNYLSLSLTICEFPLLSYYLIILLSYLWLQVLHQLSLQQTGEFHCLVPGALLVICPLPY